MAIIKIVGGHKFTLTYKGKTYSEYTRRAGGAVITLRLRKSGDHGITYQCDYFVRMASASDHDAVAVFISECATDHADLDAHFERRTRKARKGGGMTRAAWACVGYVVGVAVGALAAAGEAAKKA